MKNDMETSWWSSKWHLIVIYASVIAVVLLGLFTSIFHTEKGQWIPEIVWFLGGALLLAAIIAILWKISKFASQMEQSSVKLEKVIMEVEKTREVMGQLEQTSRLTEAAKAITYREADRKTLRETVYDRLGEKDFDICYEMIEDMSHRKEYSSLANQLRAQVDKVRQGEVATEVAEAEGPESREQVKQIEQYLENQEWINASESIETLNETEPNSSRIQALRRELVDKKQCRKQELLRAWDDAVKKEDTNHGLSILKELDQYLTPNEGLALQEAARDVFRNKLHNLGVQFSLAVSERDWDKALESGQDIIQEFPNSRMAEEIRERWDALKEKAEQQQSN